MGNFAPAVVIVSVWVWVWVCVCVWVCLCGCVFPFDAVGRFLTKDYAARLLFCRCSVYVFILELCDKSLPGSITIKGIAVFASGA